MKILMLNNYFSMQGGADLYMYSLSRLLERHGHQVRYFATAKGPYFETDYPHLDFFPENVDYKTLTIPQLLKKTIQPFYNWDAKQKLRDFLQICQPDLVHVHCIFYTLSPSVLAACYDANIPVVMTLHGPQLMCPGVKMQYRAETYCEGEHCVSGNPLPCVLNRCVDNSLIKSLGVSVEYLFRKMHGLYHGVQAYISPSEALLELAVRAGFPREKLFCVNNFVREEWLALPPVTDDASEGTDSGSYFLFFGRLSKEKGIPYLLRAMAQLPHIRLRLAGTGPNEAEYRDMARDMNLSNVEFLGFRKGDDLAKEIRGCIATILPCDWFENFPTSILESLMHGKPAIASRLGGIPEMIDHGVNGLLFGKGDVTALAEAIRKLHEQPNLARDFGRNGREKAERLYHPDLHYKRIVQIYRDLLKEDLRASTHWDGPTMVTAR